MGILRLFSATALGLTLGLTLAFPGVAQTSIQPRPEEIALQKKQKDPATAALLSLLYPGAGQFFVGDNPQRSWWILGGGTLILGGSVVGYGILADRPADSVAFGNLLITGVLLGYHLWNVRDAYEQAERYNKRMEKMERLSAEPFADLAALNASLHQAQPVVAPVFSWQTQF
jgi:hypothetical protein